MPQAAPGEVDPTSGRRAPARVEVLIRELRIGRDGGTPAAGDAPHSFVTDSARELTVSARAVVRGGGVPVGNLAVRWEVTPPDGFSAPAGGFPEGPELRVVLRRPAGNPSALGDPLRLSVRARVSGFGEGAGKVAEVVARQDLRDRLRQEYVDLGRRYVPQRAELLDRDTYVRLYGKKYPAVTFEELNFSRQPGSRERYPYIMVSEQLLETLQRTEREYGRPLVYGSAYRNPWWQTIVHGSVAESHHQYGRAADLHVPINSSPPRDGRAIANERDWLYLAAAALRGGGVWIEPMLSCNPNTAGCHVHVDVREGGSRSRLVEVAGRVTDPQGFPVAGATVRMAGMPAVTNAQGEYRLKHVVHSSEHVLTVEAPGLGLLTRPVVLGPRLTSAALQMQAGPHATLAAHTEGVEQDPDGNGLVLRLAVRNLGRSPARNLRLQPGRAGEVTPEVMEALRPGETGRFLVRLASRRAPAPVQVHATFATAGGAVRQQPLAVNTPSPEMLEFPVGAVENPVGASETHGEEHSPASGRGAPQEPDLPVPQGLTPARPGPDGGAAAGGAALGAVAGAAAGMLRRRGRATPGGSAGSRGAPREPSVLPPGGGP